MSERNKMKRTVEVTQAARRAHLLRVLRELGVAGEREPSRESAVGLREALEELGPTYVKLGQLLSSRSDLLPDVYLEELGKLVDDVPALPFEPIRQVIAEEIGLEHFARIDPEPLATASIAQIHGALLTDGRDVVVKVRRPGIEEQIAVDLQLLRRTAASVEKRSGAARLLQLRALADELEEHLLGELDFREEANNAELISGILDDFREEIVVPQVIRPYVAERALVLERVDGVRVGEPNALTEARASELADAFFRAYIRQVAVEGLYHADPHRGNVVVLGDGRLALLDFGLLGRLDEDTRTVLSLLLLAIAQNRADDVSDLILSLSLTTAESDSAGFLQDLRRTLPRYHWRPLEGIRTGEALASLQRLCLEHGIALPTAFALVGKTLSQAEDIARTLDPALDPVAIIDQEGLGVMGKELERRLEPTQLTAFVFSQLQPLLRMPSRLSQLVRQVETGALKIAIAPTELESFERVLRSTANRIGAALIVAALLIASALMAQVNHTVALAGFSCAAALGLYMLWRIMRTPGGL
jgi:ubiquinone biosynthesis protein